MIHAPLQVDHEADVQDYIEGVLSGDIIACKKVKFAVQRHLDDLKHAHERGYRFDADYAIHAINFFSMVKHTTGDYAGKPFDLFPWQKFVIWVLFGWRKISNGLRRFQHVFLSVGRGNGKSPFAAVLTLMLFGFDNPVEIRAECYTTATKRDQARIVFDEVRRYVDNEPALHSLITRRRSNLSISMTASSLEPLSSDSKSADGQIPHVITVDELHAWKEQHRELWEKLITGMGKRSQPMMIVITTAGSDESELWQEQYDFCDAVIDPADSATADDHFVFICEIDDEDDPLDESVWPKANPLLEHGVVKIDHLRSLANKAKRNPVNLANFKRYHCNKVVASTSRLITAELWSKGNLELPDFHGRTAYAGFDWGWKDDLAALGYVFPIGSVEVGKEMRHRYAIAADVWIPEGTQRNLAAEPWATWIRDGLITVTPGDTTDTEAIYHKLEQRRKEFSISVVAIDSNNCREFGSRVNSEYGIEVFDFMQSCGKYNEPTRELVNGLTEGRIHHGGNTLLEWCAKNVIAREDTRGYIMPFKKKSQDKIDPIVAIIMGISEAMFADKVRSTGMVAFA